MKKILILSILILLILTYGLYMISKSRSFQFFGNLVSRAETNKKVIALTFDDTPSENTEDVLRILREKNVKATFFAIGQNLKKYPDAAKAIVAQGNELGNHSYSHQRMIFKSQKFIQDEIESTNELIRDAGFAGEITFRPPNGKKLLGLPWYLSRHITTTIMWDVEPDTYYSGDANAIAEYAINNARPGSIILLHPFCKEECAADRQALSKIIDELRAKGYEFVTITQLLKYQE